jgi:hypothetical protein
LPVPGFRFYPLRILPGRRGAPRRLVQSKRGIWTRPQINISIHQGMMLINLSKRAKQIKIINRRNCFGAFFMFFIFLL